MEVVQCFVLSCARRRGIQDVFVANIMVCDSMFGARVDWDSWCITWAFKFGCVLE